MSGNNQKNVTITPMIRQAILQIIEKMGGQSKLAERLDISKVSVGRWVGTKNSVSAIDCHVYLILRSLMEQNGVVELKDVNFMTPEELKDAQIQPLTELTQVEQRLVRAYRKASDEQKRMLLAMIATIEADEKEDVSKSG